MAYAPLPIGTLELEQLRGTLQRYIDYGDDPPTAVLDNFRACRKEVEKIVCDERFDTYHWHMTPESASKYIELHLQSVAVEAVKSLTAQIKKRK